MATAKQKFYKWHRIIGLIALIPVISWTLSGLSHPFMSNWFRPSIAREVYKRSANVLRPAISLPEVLDRNGIKSLRNYGMIDLQGQVWYQVLGTDSVLRYYSGEDGKPLPNGDQLYATYLARYFTQDSTSIISSLVLQKTFDSEYQPINHLLPVWKVSFDRPDGMDVYVETGQSRMGTFNNSTRKAMLKVFEQMHTWQFLADIGGDRLRLTALLIAVSLMILSLISGLTIYGFFWKQFRSATEKRRGDGRADRRFVHRFHRQLGLIVSFVMLTFSVSAAFHIIVKLHNAGPQPKQYQQLIDRSALVRSNRELPIADSLISKGGLAVFDNKTWYQITDKAKKVHYFNAADGTEVKDGDDRYALYLADLYQISDASNNKKHGRITVQQLREFDNEYGFINKRLPVQKVAYPGGENRYIETTTSQLAADVTPLDRTEGFSFIILHKYFGMTWAGKNIRDLVSMLAALGVLVVALFGFAAFIKNK